MTCMFCEYTWTPRVEKPKACPRCKNYLKFKVTKVKQQGVEILEYKENE